MISFQPSTIDQALPRPTWPWSCAWASKWFLTAWPGTTHCSVPGPIPASLGLLEMQQQQDGGRVGGGFAEGMVCSGWRV